MTNPDMVKKSGAGPTPEPNLPPAQPMPAPEDDKALNTEVEPLDSYQLKPLLDANKARGLKPKHRPEGPGESSGQKGG